MPKQGLVSIFTGDGKGKTTAATGTAVRAAGHGLKVFIIFFMKGKDFVHGEVNALTKISPWLASGKRAGWTRRT